MRTTREQKERQMYLPPCVTLFKDVTVGESLLSNSVAGRDDYGNGGDGWSQGGDLGQRQDYIYGGDPFIQGNGCKAYKDDWDVELADYVDF